LDTLTSTMLLLLLLLGLIGLLGGQAPPHVAPLLLLAAAASCMISSSNSSRVARPGLPCMLRNLVKQLSSIVLLHAPLQHRPGHTDEHPKLGLLPDKQQPKVP
jgi:hypothetical protein